MSKFINDISSFLSMSPKEIRDYMELSGLELPQVVYVLHNNLQEKLNELKVDLKTNDSIAFSELAVTEADLNELMHLILSRKTLEQSETTKRSESVV